MTLIKHQIEGCLKTSNRKSENSPIELDQLRESFSLKLGSEVRNLINGFKIVVKEYVKLHNDYCRMKINEEKAKAKKPKVNEEKLEIQLATKFEAISYESEMTRISKDLVKGCPEAVQPILLKNHLNLLLGLKVEQADRPTLGSVWNQVTVFPTPSFSQGRRAGTTQAPSTGSQQNFSTAQ